MTGLMVPVAPPPASTPTRPARRKLTIKGIPGLGTVNTTVQNFRAMFAAPITSDTIAGGSGNNTLIGDGGNDNHHHGWRARQLLMPAAATTASHRTTAHGGGTSVTTGGGQDTVVFTKGYYQSLFYGRCSKALTITDFTTSVLAETCWISVSSSVMWPLVLMAAIPNSSMATSTSSRALQILQLQFDADGAFLTRPSAPKPLP